MNSILKNPDYEARLEVSLKAFESGCVIFSSTTKTFYTPRDFLDSDEKVIITKLGLDEHSNCILHHPKHAISRKIEDLQKAHKDFENFVQRMMTAFELHPIKSFRKK
jgi:hypothetical protein